MASGVRADDVVEAVRAAIAELPPGPVGVACSGGADSMALAHATIAAFGARVFVIHVDHRLYSGSSAVADGVAAWARSQGAEAVVVVVDVSAAPSLEDAARRARYAALDEIAAMSSLVGVFTAHTARDQAETVLYRIVRGTGPAGLIGIPRRRGVYVRPLLDVPRAATEAYARAHALPVWDDPMNDDDRFARVRIRRAIIPRLVGENPAIDDALCRLARASVEWRDVVDRAAADVDAGSAVQLAAAMPAVAKRALARAAEAVGIELGADHLDAVLALATRSAHGTLSIDVPGGRVVRVYDEVHFETEIDRAADVDPPPLTIRNSGGPIAVRPVQSGDRMRPARLGGHSRKLSDLFIDAKVPRADRARARVVVDADGEIVWAEHVGPAHGSAIEVEVEVPPRNSRT